MCRDPGLVRAVIPAGYMAKRVAARPEWLKAECVADIYSVSNCASKDLAYFFKDSVLDWPLNGYWLFDSPEIIRHEALSHSVDLAEAMLFFYEIHELEYDEDDGQWMSFEPSWPTRIVVPPTVRTLEGYDVVSFEQGTSPECSPLSCNGLANEVETNEHCLLPSFERAQQLLSEGRFNNVEPGPFRIFALYSVSWP